MKKRAAIRGLRGMGAIGESRQHAAPARREAEGKVAATNGHRTRGSASLPGTSPRKQRPPPYTFLRNEPTDFVSGNSIYQSAIQWVTR